MKRLLPLLFLTASLLPAAERVRVLLDTDAFNEIDDQFFVAYSLFQKRFEIEAITAAHYRWEHGSVDESYYEVLRVIEMMGLRPAFPVVRGADLAMKDEKSPVRSEATDLIARLAMKKDQRPLYVLAVGALTNVGSALVLHPEIKPRIRVIWLGGFPPDGGIREFNAANDRAAVKAVFESGVDLTVVPTETSARFLTLPYAEAEARLRHTNALGRMFLDLLRDYGQRHSKVIWDISVTAYLLQATGGPKFFEVGTEPAPRIDLASARYVRRQGPHSIRVTGKPDREAVFADLFQYFPKPHDTDPPYLISALATGDANEIRLLFSEPLDAATAGDPSCYNTPSGVKTAAAEGSAVRLLLAGVLGTAAAVAATCVKDAAGNPLLAARSSVPVRVERGAVPGLRLKAYKAAPGLNRLPPYEGRPFYETVVESLDWPWTPIPAELKSQPDVLLVAEGELYLPFDHRYEFSLHSSRFARVFLNGELLLDQGGEGDRSAQRTTFRKAGVYPLRIEQYGSSARPALTFQWSLPFHRMSLVPPQVLFHRAGSR
jgi:inosine-uridine nucleoside N-ribohydrolase